MGCITKVLVEPVERKGGDEAIVEFFSIAKGSCGIGYIADRDKKVNQDAMAVIPIGEDGFVCIVADGAGGHPQADLASKIATKAVKQKVLLALKSRTDLRIAILDGIQKANRQILELGTGAASTICVALLTNYQLQTFHAGDSEILVFGYRGVMKYKTVSHSVLGMGVEAGLEEYIDVTDPVHSSVVTNLLGCKQLRITVGSPIGLAKKDAVIVCSDGMTDNLTYDEIGNVLKRRNFNAVFDELIHATKQNMYSPNPQRIQSKPDDLALFCFRR